MWFLIKEDLDLQLIHFHQEFLSEHLLCATVGTSFNDNKITTIQLKEHNIIQYKIKPDVIYLHCAFLTGWWTMVLAMELLFITDTIGCTLPLPCSYVLICYLYLKSVRTGYDWKREQPCMIEDLKIYQILSIKFNFRGIKSE